MGLALYCLRLAIQPVARLDRQRDDHLPKATTMTIVRTERIDLPGTLTLRKNLAPFARRWKASPKTSGRGSSRPLTHTVIATSSTSIKTAFLLAPEILDLLQVSCGNGVVRNFEALNRAR